jgi:lycopene cyclase domain-containing protein
MTYFEFLLTFLVAPIIFLLAIQLWEARKHKAVTGFRDGPSLPVLTGIHVILALLYTTPWDNYLVATGVWYYNPALVTGILIGYVPLEEYTFFILETVFVGLWWGFLARRIPLIGKFEPRAGLRLGSSAFLAILWLASGAVFFSGWKPGTYLSITLLWALPPIILQTAFGADILWRYRRLIRASILPMGLYLSVADSLAITSGTWTVAPAQSTGLFAGSLPIEDGIFFFLTVMLLTFGMTLARAPESRQRLCSWQTHAARAGSARSPSPD